MTGQKLYVIGHPDGYVKIGVSKSPGNRLGDLQSATPYELWVITEIEQRQDRDRLPSTEKRETHFSMNTVEDAVHEYYHHNWKKREWFKPPKNEIHALGKLRSISLSAMADVLHVQHARSWEPDASRDEYVSMSPREKTIKHHLEIARDRSPMEVFV